MALAASSDGALWLASPSMVCTKRSVEGLICSFRAGQIDGITALASHADGAWIGTDNGLFFGDLDGITLRFAPARAPELRGLDIRSLAAEPGTGALWIGSAGRGLFRYDPRPGWPAGLSWLSPGRGEVSSIGGGQDPRPGRPNAVPSPNSPPLAAITHLWTDGRGAVYVVQGDLVFDTPIPAAPPRAAGLAVAALALVGALLVARRRR